MRQPCLCDGVVIQQPADAPLRKARAAVRTGDEADIDVVFPRIRLGEALREAYAREGASAVHGSVQPLPAAATQLLKAAVVQLGRIVKSTATCHI